MSPFLKALLFIPVLIARGFIALWQIAHGEKPHDIDWG